MPNFTSEKESKARDFFFETVLYLFFYKGAMSDLTVICQSNSWGKLLKVSLSFYFVRSRHQVAFYMDLCKLADKKLLHPIHIYRIFEHTTTGARMLQSCWSVFIFKKKKFSFSVCVIIPDIDNGSIDITVVGLEGLAGGWLFNSPVLDPPPVNHI